MNKGKVIIIGNKRAGKTTLTMKLHNELLKEQCEKYNFKLVNTSIEENTSMVLDNLVKEIVGE